jgi:hypothetical protein
MKVIGATVPRRQKALLVVLIIAGFLLAACGSQATPTQAPPAARPTRTPGASPSKTPYPTPTKAVVTLGTALEWYPVAEQAALAWQADAVLTAADGNNISRDGGSLPCNGQAEQWSYSFASVAAQKTLSVYVRAGTVSSQMDSALTYMGSTPPLSAEVLALYSELYPASDWKVDSTQVAQTTNALFKAKYNVEPEQIVYVLFNTKYLDVLNNKATNWMYWVISYDPEKYPFQVKVDAQTGAVKNKP